MKKQEEGFARLKRTYKSRLFEIIFSDKKELLELYNAVNGTSYQNSEELEINTLENAIYMSMKNDISFLLDSRVTLYEHQSTYNPNLPLRYLMYISNIYSRMVRDENLYGRRLIKLPAPGFIIFYNGTEERPDRETMQLSSAYEVQDRELSLELTAILININKGHNNDLMDRCKTLRDYSIYVEKVRAYAKVMSIEEAVEKAIEECIKADILAEFLKNNRTEAKTVSIFEYDEERHIRQTREEGEEVGKEIGKEIGVAIGIEKINQLNRALLQDKRFEDLERSAEDREYQKQLLKEYGLEDE